MKIVPIAQLIVYIAGIGGTVWLFNQEIATEKPAPQEVFLSVITPDPTDAPPPAEPEPEPVIEKKPEPKPILVQQKPKPEPKPKMQLVQKEGTKPKPVPQQFDYSKYLKQQTARFTSLMNRLAKETDPNKRRSLIQSISQFIRVDTLATMDWVASLGNAEEQHLAMEAINKHALTGIGAQITMDEVGLPKIQNSTLLGGVEAAGIIEHGDYISGMVQPDGSEVYFAGWPLQKIVQHLRGNAGDNIILMMERPMSNGQFESYDAPITRRLIVMPPPDFK